ncbi:MAG: autophagy protein 6 [Alyxoria varia]|nr:MAG: autophagy protein 6 [Alyxoria varia]
MYCQKCRAPLRLHGSLDNLNSAAFHLLADAPTATESTGATIHQERSENLHSQPLYSPEQKQIYETASSTTPSNPVFAQTVPPSRPNHALDAPSSAGQDALASGEPANPPPLPKDHSAMSFVDITQSQVVPASIAQKTSNQRRSDTRRRPSSRNSTKSPNNRNSNIKSSTTDTTTRLETTTTLFSILTSRTDIDHPICTECTDTLLASLTARLTDATRERDTYISYLQTAQADAPTPAEAAAAQSELDSVRSEESTAMEELEEVERQKRELEKEIATLDAEGERLDIEEEGFWRERNELARVLRSYTDERDSLTGRFEHDTRVLERLKRTNVYNDTFNIGHDGHFGTINGLRLGRMPGGGGGGEGGKGKGEGGKGGPVEWAEINAAWGCACLLLDTIAKRLKYKFRGYELRPMGSTSSIEKFEHPASSPTKARSTTSRANTNTNAQRRGGASAGGSGGGVRGGGGSGRGGSDSARTRQPSSSTSTPSSPPDQPQNRSQNDGTNKGTSTTLPLHYTSDLPISLSFLHRNFDMGMTAFLDCVQQLGSYIEAGSVKKSTPSNTPSRSGSRPNNGGGGVGGGGETRPNNGAPPSTREPSLKMPYPITPTSGRINDVSIRLADRKRGAQGDEQWTRACKYTLTCLKFLLAVGSSSEEEVVEEGREGGG